MAAQSAHRGKNKLMLAVLVVFVVLATILGAIIPDSYPVPVPAGMLAGGYRLIVGMYRYPSMERLQVLQEDQSDKDFVDVTIIPVP